jgi:predicted transcriptional regulator
VSQRRNEVTDAELELLKLLWERGPSTIRDLSEIRYPDGGPSHYATVQKLLDRLEGKGCVRRKRGERANVFVSAVDRGKLLASGLRRTAERLCDGELAPVLCQLVESAELSPAELAELRALVDRLAPRERRSKPR